MDLILSLALALNPSQPAKLPDIELDPFLAKLVKPNDKDTPLQQLQKERVKERGAAVARMDAAIRFTGSVSEHLADYTELSGALWANAAELAGKPADVAHCYQRRVAALEGVEGLVGSRAMIGSVGPILLKRARANRLAAEIDLLKFPGAPVPEIDPFIAGVLKLNDTAARVRALRQELVREQALAVGMYKTLFDMTRSGDNLADYVELRCALWRNTAELVATPAEVVKCHEKRIEAAKEWEKYAEVKVTIGQAPPRRWFAARARSVDAEIDLLSVKGAKDAPAPKLDPPPKGPALKCDPPKEAVPQPAQPVKQKGAFVLPKEPALDPLLAELVKPDDKDTPLRRLQKERCRQWGLAVSDIKDQRDKGLGADSREGAELRDTLWRNAAELATNPADAVKCHEKRVEAAQEWEKFVADRVATGGLLPHHAHTSKASRIDAEIGLLKLKDAMKGGK